MELKLKEIEGLSGFFKIRVLPRNALEHLFQMIDDQFIFKEQLALADSIHLHIKVASVENLLHHEIIKAGGRSQNLKEGYIKYSFLNGINLIFSSIPISEEERLGIPFRELPYLDHIGIDIRNENEHTYSCFNRIPTIASSKGFPFEKQGGPNNKVNCCHVQVNEKYWVYPSRNVYWEFAFGRLIVSDTEFGCDLRPANPSLEIDVENLQSCCGATKKS